MNKKEFEKDRKKVDEGIKKVEEDLKLIKEIKKEFDKSDTKKVDIVEER